LFGVGSTATRAQSASHASSEVKASTHFDQGWRRTRDGWERVEQLQKPRFDWQSPAEALPHPALLGLAQITLSLGALFVFGTPRR
ncbi:MAG: hypothetical protein AAGF97_09695, partial [Planctomycetota bacterium]